MKLKALLTVVLVMGCYGIGPVGPPGPKGDPGLQGPQATVPAIVWKNPVGTVIAYGQPPMHRDGNGNWWPVETDFAQVDSRKTLTASLVFISTNCTGPSFYQGAIVGVAAPRPPFHPPRLPFFVAAENQWRVRLDTARTQVINVQSTSDGTTCFTNTDLNEPVLATGPASSMVVASPPDLGSTGPIHMETFQD